MTLFVSDCKEIGGKSDAATGLERRFGGTMVLQI